MKFVLAAATFLLGCDAFSPLSAFKPVTRLSSIADEFGIPCEEDCATYTYKNLPASVHPGVVSGQALIDLLNHAKDNGKIFQVVFTNISNAQFLV
jgi:fructose-bisphosphate aldolase, class II